MVIYTATLNGRYIESDCIIVNDHIVEGGMTLCTYLEAVGMDDVRVTSSGSCQFELGVAYL